MTSPNSGASTPGGSQTKGGKLKLTRAEKSASFKLALLFALRMLGLFMLTPVFAKAGEALIHGNNSILIGLAIGAYGVTQAIMQIPMGMASDRYGRKAIVIIGMGLFVLGSLICAQSDNVYGVIVGRAIQGFGAVSAAITAWVADLVRPQVRTRVMAMIGGSIGMCFALSLVISPLVVKYFDLHGVFWAMTGMGVAGCLLALIVAPGNQPGQYAIEDTRASVVLKNPNLLALDVGVFCLHFTMMSLFVVLPPLISKLSGTDAGDLWKFYLPVILASFVIMVPLIFFIEKRYKHKLGLLLSIGLITIVLFGMPLAAESLIWLLVMVTLYFVGFNIIEALQPSLVTRLCPPEQKGLALGFYQMSQALGIAAGGAVGGLLDHRVAIGGPLLMCAVICVCWLLFSRSITEKT